MGLQNPLGYVGYEHACLRTFIDLIERFCGGCHTDERCGGCNNCKIGICIYACKEYLLNIYIPDSSPERELKVVKKIEKEIKKINPEPLMLCTTITSDNRNPSRLLKIKELLFDLEFLINTRELRKIIEDG